MQLPAKAHQGDVVRCDVRGNVFLAQVRGKLPAGSGLLIEPLPGTRPTTYTQVSSTQVTDYYRKLGKRAS